MYFPHKNVTPLKCPFQPSCYTIEMQLYLLYNDLQFKNTNYSNFTNYLYIDRYLPNLPNDLPTPNLKPRLKNSTFLVRKL